MGISTGVKDPNGTTDQHVGDKVLQETPRVKPGMDLNLT
jgi:hypothetical protein